jgi:hypothetical protein
MVLLKTCIQGVAGENGVDSAGAQGMIIAFLALVAATRRTRSKNRGSPFGADFQAKMRRTPRPAITLYINRWSRRLSFGFAGGLPANFKHAGRLAHPFAGDLASRSKRLPSSPQAARKGLARHCPPAKT